MASNTPSVRLSTGTQDIIAKVIVALVIAGIVYAVIKRLFRAIPSLWGEGLTDAEQQLVNARFKLGDINTGLYQRGDYSGRFTDASHDERARIQVSMDRLRGIAQRIADAPGMVNDDEQALVNAFLSIPSLYDLLWVARVFPGVDVPSLGVFDTDAGAPELGIFVDAFAQPADWLRIMDHLSTLPKYL